MFLHVCVCIVADMDTLKCLIALKVDELEGKKNSAGEETRVDFGSASGSGSGSGGQMTVAIVYGAVIATLKRELRELGSDDDAKIMLGNGPCVRSTSSSSLPLLRSVPSTSCVHGAGTAQDLHGSGV